MDGAVLRRWALLVCNLFLPFAILIFASGFFPYKPFIAGRNEFSPEDTLKQPDAPFDRIIFMVVDALRSDFVYSENSGFEFVQQLIRDGDAVPFTAHASSPTITMPKVKAITTGSVPSFLDVILNFAESDTTSTLAHMDTWLNQLRHLPAGKLVMYGDDTWLKLFPDFFTRHDGTSSFFVSDFTEVDNNVTRHVADELQQNDWNGWFMHYLGLDHIGHKSGPESPHMIPKQREMDLIVKTIFGKIRTESHLSSALFVLCGDHGMNEAGNHGGAAPGETSPALVFMSPKFRDLNSGLSSPTNPERDFEYYDVVEQSDIAPTVAGLLGFPVPLNNLGVFIPKFLQLWKEDDQRHLVTQNVRQMHRILEETLGTEAFQDDQLSQVQCDSRNSELQRLQCGWLAQAQQTSLADVPRQLLQYEYLKTAQNILSSTASNYDVARLQTGIIAAASVFLVSATALVLSIARAGDFPGIGLTTLITGLYSAMMFASSFVEEEHHFWYWSSTLIACYLFSFRVYCGKLHVRSLATFATAMCMLRILRRWNQTGQKHAGSPDIGRIFLRQHTWVLWALVFGTYALLTGRLARRRLPGVPRVLIMLYAVALGFCAFIFRVEFTRADSPELLVEVNDALAPFALPLGLVGQARLVFLLIAAGTGCLYLSRTCVDAEPSRLKHETLPVLRDLVAIFLATETRVNNVPLLAIFDILFRSFGDAQSALRQRLSSIELAVIVVVFQHTCFFAFGGTNAISSVDLSNAYNGVSGYNVVAVGILTFVSNWIGPVWWALAATEILASGSDTGSSFTKYALTLTLFASCSLAATMVACTVLRTHLFIWTVFSPKYLYSMAWSLGQHVAVNIGLTRILLWTIRKEAMW